MAYLRGQRSSFPGKEDDFSEAFDLSNQQMQSAKKLNELRTQTTPLSPAQEQEILALTSELRENIFTAEDWNKLGDAVYELQLFFNEEVRDYILEKQAEWDTYVNDFNYQGRWVVGKNYKFQNMVTLPNGDLFIARIDHRSSDVNQPSQTADTGTWAKIGAKGDKGDIGLNATYKGNWASNIAYVLGNAVTHVHQGVSGGLIYVAKRASTNKAPHLSPDDWQLFTQFSTGTTRPLGAQLGTHFYRIVD